MITGWERFASDMAAVHGEEFVRDFCKSITDELRAEELVDRPGLLGALDDHEAPPLSDGRARGRLVGDLARSFRPGDLRISLGAR